MKDGETVRIDPTMKLVPVNVSGKKKKTARTSKESKAVSAAK